MVKRFSLLAISLGLVLTGCQSMSNSHNSVRGDGNHVSVDNVDWQKYAATAYQAPTTSQIPSNMSHVVFIRPATNLAAQSSANVALDNRYLVSLQGGNYTETNICSGNALLSVVPTGVKINDLQASSKAVNLTPQQTYYYVVDVDSTSGQPSLTLVSTDNALQLLNNKALQTHQVSRIVNNCAAPVAPEPVIAQPAPVVVAKTEAIRLGVQFDTAKSIIKSQYQPEIVQMAQFLNRHPEVTATIEGHTDNVGKSAANLALSQSRADAVKAMLIANGVAPQRLEAVGYGETRPVADNKTPTGREQNRRVMVVTHS